MELADPELQENTGERIALYFNPAKAEMLFAGSGHTFQEIAYLGRDRKPLPRFPLAASLKARAHVETSQVESANVIAKLPGSDPKLKGEYVVLSAHIDHIGIGEPIKGDRIYNGAMDNGSGCALLLDMAASLKDHPVRTIQRNCAAPSFSCLSLPRKRDYSGRSTSRPIPQSLGKLWWLT
jgi:hypothetical protein